MDNIHVIEDRRSDYWRVRSCGAAWIMVFLGAATGIIMDSEAAKLYLALYMMPFAVSATRGHRLDMVVLAINVLFGWTVIGWIIAMIIALFPHRQIAAVRW